MDKNEIFCSDGLNMRIQQKNKGGIFLKWLVLILYPSKHGDKHQTYLDTMHSDWDIDERRIFRIGSLHLHIGWIAQRWQSGIIQILKEHTSEVWKQQKNLCTDSIARFSKNLWFGNWTINTTANPWMACDLFGIGCEEYPI